MFIVGWAFAQSILQRPSVGLVNTLDQIVSDCSITDTEVYMVEWVISTTDLLFLDIDALTCRGQNLLMNDTHHWQYISGWGRLGLRVGDSSHTMLQPVTRFQIPAR